MANKTFRKPHNSTKDATGNVFVYRYIYDTERLHCEMQKVTEPLKTTGVREEEEEGWGGRGSKVMSGVCDRPAVKW